MTTGKKSASAGQQRGALKVGVVMFYFFTQLNSILSSGVTMRFKLYFGFKTIWFISISGQRILMIEAWIGLGFFQVPLCFDAVHACVCSRTGFVMTSRSYAMETITQWICFNFNWFWDNLCQFWIVTKEYCGSCNWPSLKFVKPFQNFL